MPERKIRPAFGAVAETPVEENFRLHQSKIDRAMGLPGTRTETGTIERALDLDAFRETLVDGICAMRGAELVDVFEGDRT